MRSLFKLILLLSTFLMATGEPLYMQVLTNTWFLPPALLARLSIDTMLYRYNNK